MKLLIQFPTYGRPEKFLKVLAKYVGTCSSFNELYFNINCDASDLSMTNTHIHDCIQSIISTKNNIDYALNYDHDTTKISAINDHVDGHDFDIVICASDDMVPKVYSWDTEIVNAMKTYFPNLDGCVHFNDGNTDGELITFSIIGRKLYDYFGYIYHPDYKGLYCDNEFTEEVARLNKVAYVNKIIISHEHWSIKDSENHNQLDIAVHKTLHYSGRDKEVYENRKRLGFPKQRITND